MSRTIAMPARFANMRSVAGIKLTAGAATVTTLSTRQIAALTTYGATIDGVLPSIAVPATGFEQSAGIAVPVVNTATATTSAAIDAIVFPTATQVTPFDGVVASDPTAKLLLIRQAGKWYKTAALTQIA